MHSVMSTDKMMSWELAAEDEDAKEGVEEELNLILQQLLGFIYELSSFYLIIYW